MYKIVRTGNNIDITLTRGDSFLVTVEMFNEDGDPVTPEEGEEVRFALKKDYSDTSTVIFKEVPLDTMLLELKPADTKPLQMGRQYVYDIQYTNLAGIVDTFIKGRFTIDMEVD